MLKSWEFLPEIFITSSEKKKGIEEILNFIETHNKSFDSLSLSLLFVNNLSLSKEFAIIS